MEGDHMSLTKQCKEYVEHSVLVLPYYGHGWSRAGLERSEGGKAFSIGPPPFRLQVKEMVSCAGSLMGASGIVREPKHALSGQWCGVFLRMGEEVDFVNRPGHYMVWIASVKPLVQPSLEKALYEWVTFDKSSPCLCGYGMVAENVDCMRRDYEITMSTRRSVLGAAYQDDNGGRFLCNARHK
jgi:hypothetical protein